MKEIQGEEQTDLQTSTMRQREDSFRLTLDCVCSLIRRSTGNIPLGLADRQDDKE